MRNSFNLDGVSNRRACAMAFYIIGIKDVELCCCVCFANDGLLAICIGL